MADILPFPNQSKPAPQLISAPDEADRSIAKLVGEANRLVDESRRCREYVAQSIELIDAAEQRAALVEDATTRSALLGILAEKRKAFALLDHALVAELQSFFSLSSEIHCDGVADVAGDPAGSELVGGGSLR